MAKASTTATSSPTEQAEAAAVYEDVGAIHPWADNPRWKDKKKREAAVRESTARARRSRWSCSSA